MQRGWVYRRNLHLDRCRLVMPATAKKLLARMAYSETVERCETQRKIRAASQEGPLIPPFSQSPTR